MLCMTGRDAKCCFNRQRVDLCAYPIRPWSSKQHFYNRIQVITCGQNKSNPQSHPCIDAPVHQRQNKKEKVFVPQKSEELHRPFEPTTKRLNGKDPVNSVLYEDIHMSLLGSRIARQPNSLAQVFFVILFVPTVPWQGYSQQS